jgi:hypothetical protein
MSAEGNVSTVLFLEEYFEVTLRNSSEGNM